MRIAAAAVLILLATPAAAIPPPTTPVITSVVPNSGRPTGGEVVYINGARFRTPVRVLFDVGEPVPREAFVVAVTEQRIDVITPSIAFQPPTQQVVATLHVITEAGTAREQRLTVRDGFTYRNLVLTPRIVAVAPATGSVLGGSRLTIFGDGFQAPVQAHFIAPGGAEAELQVLVADFGQIVIVAPPASTFGAAAGEPIAVRVRNIASGTEHTLPGAFSYRALSGISAVSPGVGPAEGGTRVTIDGFGFGSVVEVSVAGVRADVLRVTSTQIVALTRPATGVICGDLAGPIRIVDLDTGQIVEGGTFTYIAMPAQIVALEPSVATPGSRIEARLSRPIDERMIVTVAGQVVPSKVSGATVTFLAPQVDFPLEACTFDGIAGLEPMPVTADVRMRFEGDCGSLRPVAMLLRPRDPVCVLPPKATVILPARGSCLRFGRTNEPRTATLALANRATFGTAPLVVIGIAVDGPDASEFIVRPRSRELIATAGQRIELTVTYRALRPGQSRATVTFSTNDPEQPSIEVCLRGSALAQ